MNNGIVFPDFLCFLTKPSSITAEVLNLREVELKRSINLSAIDTGRIDDDNVSSLYTACANKASVYIIAELLTAYPKAIRKKGGKDQKLPLCIASDSNASIEVIALLLDTLTRGGISDSVTIDDLTEFLFSIGEKHVDAFAAFLDRRSTDILLLANTPDLNGRTALSIAGPKCRAVLKQRLFLCGRYELGEQAHSSVTSRVFFSLDHDPAAEVNGAPPQVALKFLLRHDHFKAEIEAREQAVAAKAAFLPVLASCDADVDPSFNAELTLRQLNSHRYMLVMPAGDRSLEAAIVAESAEIKWPSEAKRACREVAEALAALHSAGFVHRDVKPRNIMRLGAHYKLIDFDAAVAIGKPQSGKLSTAYAPPEAYNICPSGVQRQIGLQASIKADAWSFGATLYRALRNSTLVLVVADDADGDSELYTIAEWSDATKAAKLASIPDAFARNLLGQLLHKDPAKRPSLARVLEHSYFTGKKPTRLNDDPVEWDVFISYRVASDAKIAEALHTELSSLGLRVYWDKVCLLPGQEWRDGFFDGLVKSRLFLPIISRSAIKTVDSSNNNVWGNGEELKADSVCDNVLLEHRAALECRDRGLLEAILPLFVGDEVVPGSGNRGEYFKGGCAPRPADTAVVAVEKELRAQLDRAGLGTPYADSVTARTVFNRITAFQAALLENGAAAALKSACAGVRKALLQPLPQSISNSPSSPSSITWTRVVDPDGTLKFISSNGVTFTPKDFGL